jgi:hypothetical protein
MNCPNCGGKLPRRAETCPYCGLQRYDPPKSLEIQANIKISLQPPYKNSVLKSGENLFIINMRTFYIHDSNLNIVGTFRFPTSESRRDVIISDTENNLILSVSKSPSSERNVFIIRNSDDKKIIKIKKVISSKILNHFYIESPINNQKWYSITKSKHSSYKVKSFATNRDAAKFGLIENFSTTMSELQLKEPEKIYLLKIQDDMVDQLILLGAFFTIYISDF